MKVILVMGWRYTLISLGLNLQQEYRHFTHTE